MVLITNFSLCRMQFLFSFQKRMSTKNIRFFLLCVHHLLKAWNSGILISSYDTINDEKRYIWTKRNETKRIYNKRLKVRNVNFTWNIHFKVITLHFMRLDSLYTRALIIHIDKNLYLCQRIMFHLGMFAKR